MPKLPKIRSSHQPRVFKPDQNYTKLSSQKNQANSVYQSQAFEEAPGLQRKLLRNNKFNISSMQNLISMQEVDLQSRFSVEQMQLDA